jgi:hypothetical protein
MLEGTSDFILPRARKRQGHSSAIRLVGLSLIANGMMEMASITVAFSTGNMPEAAMGLFTGIHPVIASIDIVLGIALLVRAQPLLLTIISTFLMLQMIAIFLLGIAHQQSLVITLGGLLYVPLLALIIWRHSANKNTVILAAIPLLVYFVASTFIAFKLASEALPSTALSGPKGADGSRTIMGKSGYHIRLPDDGWRLVSSDFIEQRNTQIDLLISHSETSSLVSTFDLPVMQGSQEIDDTTDVLLASAREGLTNFIVRGREPFVGYPKNGRLIHLAGTLNGTDVEGWMLVMSSEGHLYQVNARTLRQNFPSFGSTLRSVVESFALPGASRDAAAQ